jgi:hypothetical protein
LPASLGIFFWSGNKDPETRFATRLKNEQERHQVFLYLQPMIERERLSGAAKTAR